MKSSTILTVSMILGSAIVAGYNFFNKTKEGKSVSEIKLSLVINDLDEDFSFDDIVYLSRKCNLDAHYVVKNFTRIMKEMEERKEG